MKRMLVPSFKSLLLFAVFQSVTLFTNAQKKVTIASPDNKIAVECSLSKEGNATYIIKHLGQQVLEPSRLGLIREDEDFSKNLSFVAESKTALVKDSYLILTAKKSNVSYSANKKIISLKNGAGSKLNIIFQVSNDGVAFKYEFPGTSTDVKKITQELTSFHFNDSARAWLQPKTEAQSGWEHTNPSYEAHYMMDIATGTPSPTKNGWVYPAMFHYKNTWLLITEAALGRTYCGTALQQQSPNSEYSIGFPQSPEKYTNGILNPESKLPWQTPWRIIAIGNLKTVTESTLGTDLAFPAKKMDSSFIKPGRASWSWITLKDDSIVYSVQKRYIDYAADMKWEYCLIDADWDRKIGYDKIKELSDYAATKKVGLILWYNSAGAWNTVKYTPKDKLLTHEDRVKEFTRLKNMGIKGLKIDFFAGDGQSMINYYQDILEDAAQFQFLINFHGATLPRGWQRTYPNLMTTEAVYGYEMITFGQKDADKEPEHAVMCAFARNAFDPMDFTPVCLYKIPKIKRKTTSAFELALSVVFLSGIQHFVDGPDGMSHVQPEVKTFMQNVPGYWDETKFIDGYPGKFYVVARRSGNKWFVAGINGEGAEHKINLDLSFLTKQKTVKFYEDAAEPLTFTVKNESLPAGKKTSVTMKPNGGFVVVVE